MLQHIELHICQTQLIKGFHDRELNLSHVELSLLLFIFVVAQALQIFFDLLLKLKVSNFSITVLHLTSKSHHRMLILPFLRLSLSVIIISCSWIHPLPVFLVLLFPSLDLERLLQQIVMIHQLEILEEVGVSLSHVAGSVAHDSEEHLCLVVGHHEHLDVLSLHLFKALILTEQTLLLDLDSEFL